jgi:hypothetical protein
MNNLNEDENHPTLLEPTVQQSTSSEGVPVIKQTPGILKYTPTMAETTGQPISSPPSSGTSKFTCANEQIKEYVLITAQAQTKKPIHLLICYRYDR